MLRKKTQKYNRPNHSNYITKAIRKEILSRSRICNKFSRETEREGEREGKKEQIESIEAATRGVL